MSLVSTPPCVLVLLLPVSLPSAEGREAIASIFTIPLFNPRRGKKGEVEQTRQSEPVLIRAVVWEGGTQGG